MVIPMFRGTVVLLADPEGVAYRIVRTVAESSTHPKDVERGLPVGVIASGTAPRVCDVAALVEVLFGERWAVN